MRRGDLGGLRQLALAGLERFTVGLGIVWSL